MTYHTPVEAHFFCPRKTKPKASETCLKARNPPGPVICGSKNIKGMATSHQLGPKPKEEPSPFKSQIHVCQSSIWKFKIIQKKRGKMAST